MGYGVSTVYVSLAPLFHIAGLSSSVSVTLSGGAHVFVDRTSDPVVALEAVDRHRVNTLVMVPAMLHALLTSPQLQPPKSPCRGLASVRAVLVGGQSLTTDLWTRASRHMPDAR